jgi:hypothetical protein
MYPKKSIGRLVQERLSYASSALRHYRTLSHNIVQLYLGIYIDTHVPLHKAIQLNPAITLAQVYDAGIEPEIQCPWSQFTLPDHVTSADIIAHVPTEPIARVLAKAVRIVRSIKHGIKQKAKDPGCIEFVTACIHASLLGNYYHAKFKNPHALTTIEERIEILDQTARVLEECVDNSLAEYIAALVPIYPYTADPDITWYDFTETAIFHANRNIRLCKNIPKPACVDATKLSHKTEDDPSVGLCFSECLLPTGHRSTYICPLCRGVSAYVVNKPRGFKSIKIPIDPFGTPADPSPVVACLSCNIECVFVQLHGIYLCITPSTALVVCPVCNHLTAVTGPLATTTCTLCESGNTVTRLCYYDNKHIVAEAYTQLSIDTATHTLEALDACRFHWTGAIIKDRILKLTPYTAMTRKKNTNAKRHHGE